MIPRFRQTTKDVYAPTFSFQDSGDFHHFAPAISRIDFSVPQPAWAAGHSFELVLYVQ